MPFKHATDSAVGLMRERFFFSSVLFVCWVARIRMGIGIATCFLRIHGDPESLEFSYEKLMEIDCVWLMSGQAGNYRLAKKKDGRYAGRF